MAAKSLWFGTRGYETWVKAPQPGGDSSRVGYAGSIQYLNGGAGIVTSQAAHREYNWSWGNATRADDLRDIVDFAEGVYDTADGVNLIYFIDPVAAPKNILPQNWATPSLGLGDGMPLLNDVDPQPVDTPDNNYRYPARGARYAGGTDAAKLYLPIPPGFSLWLGVHGTSTGGGAVMADVVQGANVLSTGAVELLDVNTSQRVNTEYQNPLPDAGSGYDYGTGAYGDGPYGGAGGGGAGVSKGVVLHLDTSESGSTVTLYGLIAQIWRIGVTPPGGNFISGQGHSGCQFAQHPTETPYWAPEGEEPLLAATAKLVETGAWL